MINIQTTAVVESGDVNLFVRKFGKRTDHLPVLILHGANYYDSADWIDVCQQMAKDREVVAFDARGFGNSSWSASKDYGLAAVLRDVQAVVNHVGWERVVLVGHSRGGAQALLVAARCPEMVAGLVLVDYNPARGFGPPGGVVPPSAQHLAVFPTVEAALETTTRYKVDPLTPEMRTRALKFFGPIEGGLQLIKRDPSFLDQASDAGVDLGLLGGYEELANTKCPVLVISAKRSASLEQRDLLRLNSMSRVQVRNVDSGHDVVGEASRAFVSELSEWLGSTF